MRMPELKPLARERRLRGYSRLRKVELIAFLQDNEHQAQRQQRPPQICTWELQREPQNEVRQPELEALLTKWQLKHRRNKDSKPAKKVLSLYAEIDNLKSQMEGLEDKITKASQSTNARFKRKKIRSMKREADRIAEKLGKSERALESLKLRLPAANQGRKAHPLNRNKCLEVKIAELNKKIRRAKNKRSKERLIAKRDALRLELNLGSRSLDEAFSGAYRCYRIDGIKGMDADPFFNKTRRFLIDLLSRETRDRVVCTQATTWIRFVKDGVEQIELVFNSRMLAVYNLSKMGEIVIAMITHMKQQIENPALRDSKFVFDEVI